MDRLVESCTPDYSDEGCYVVGGCFVSEEEYYELLTPDCAFDPCIEEVMFNASNQELNELLKHGDEDEKRQARMEIAVRECEANFLIEKGV